MRSLFLLSLLFSSLPALADSVNVQLFKSPFNLNYGMLESAIHDNSPWDEKAWEPKYFFSGDYHYVKDPLVVINTSTNTRVRSLVNSVHTADLALGYFFNPRMSVYAQLPLTLSSLPGESSEFGIADSRIAGKFALGDDHGSLHFALQPELILPTGSKTRFLSDDSISPKLLFIAENDFGSFRMVGNIGFQYANGAQATGIDYRKRIPLGLGAAIPIARKWLLNLEANGALAFPTSQKQNASEFYGGVSYSPVKYVTWLAGASLGAFDKAGSSDYRIQAAVRMYFKEKEKRQVPVRDLEPTPPPPPPKVEPKARMVYDGNGVQDHIEILEEIQFDHNKDTLKKHSKKVLDDVADIIREHAAGIKTIEVEGHTSFPGSDAYNLKLSWRRARAVVSYLTIEQKIPAKMLVPKGYGERRPKYKEGHATAAQLELNRRVEIKVNRKK